MRRTEQEFKAEVLRRSSAYRAKQKQMRKKVFTTVLCFALVVFGIHLAMPMLAVGGGGSNKAAAPESVMHSTAVLQPAEPQAAAPMEDNAAAMILEDCAEAAPEDAPAAVKIACGTGEITLDADDSVVVMNYLASGQWESAAANCLWDYTIYADGATYFYHSDCGRMQDESGQLLSLSGADRQIFNDIVGKCPMLLD